MWWIMVWPTIYRKWRNVWKMDQHSRRCAVNTGHQSSFSSQSWCFKKDQTSVDKAKPRQQIWHKINNLLCRKFANSLFMLMKYSQVPCFVRPRGKFGRWKSSGWILICSQPCLYKRTCYMLWALRGRLTKALLFVFVRNLKVAVKKCTFCTDTEIFFRKASNKTKSYLT